MHGCKWPFTSKSLLCIISKSAFWLTSKGGSIGSLDWELFHSFLLWKEKVYILDFCSLLCCISGKNEIQPYWFQACNDDWNMEEKAALKECKTDSRYRTDVQCPAVIDLSCIRFWKRNIPAAGLTGNWKIAWFGKELILVEMQIPGYQKTIASLSWVAQIKECQVSAANLSKSMSFWLVQWEFEEKLPG